MTPARASAPAGTMFSPARMERPGTELKPVGGGIVADVFDHDHAVGIGWNGSAGHNLDGLPGSKAEIAGGLAGADLTYDFKR